MTAVPPTTDAPEPDAPGRAERRPYRPPVGVPIEKQRRTAGAVVSVLLHLLVVMLLLFPFFGSDLVAEFTGAGGPGPAGGGGGGTGGTGGGRVVNERVQYVLPPPPPPVVRSETEFIQPPVEKPPEVPPPEVTPPVVPPPDVTPAPTASVASADINLPAADAAAKTAGSGGGSGNDGSTGSGSGTGGGIGSGIGTGTGSGVGAGTGGGTGKIFPPTPSELFIPPIPVPRNVKGQTITIVFDVDSTGKPLDFEFTPTRDAAYNRKISALLAEIRFRPATDGTGRAVRAKYPMEFTF